MPNTLGYHFDRSAYGLWLPGDDRGHLLIGYSPLNIERTVKWLSQEMTKAVHRNTPHAGPVFCKGRWLQFMFDQRHWMNVIRYIEAHNVRNGLIAKPYSFIES